MDVEIITPDKTLFKGQAQSVIMPGIGGSLGILEHHAPLITALKPGEVVITASGGEVTEFSVVNGTAEVLNNKVLLLVEQ
jgi:F-type H+-transporting ATPase subunit epsilon